MNLKKDELKHCFNEKYNNSTTVIFYKGE